MKSFTIISVGCPDLEYLQQHLSQIFEFGESPVAVEQGSFVRNSLISFNSCPWRADGTAHATPKAASANA
jgi:hypothetical protein